MRLLLFDIDGTPVDCDSTVRRLFGGALVGPRRHPAFAPVTG